MAMTLNEYQVLAQRTCNTESVIAKLVNGVLGLCGETGECSDLLKKHLYQGHTLDTPHMAKELGDVLWYVAEVATGLGMTLEEMEADGTLELLTKKEKFKLLNEKEKLERFLGGIKDMPELPGALFVIDPRKEKIAVTEAKKLGIPVVAIVDTNCDPDDVDYVIPGNDDAIRAVKLLASVISDAVLEAKQGESMAEAAEEAVVEEAVEVQE